MEKHSRMCSPPLGTNMRGYERISDDAGAFAPDGVKNVNVNFRFFEKSISAARIHIRIRIHICALPDIRRKRMPGATPEPASAQL